MKNTSIMTVIFGIAFGLLISVLMVFLILFIQTRKNLDSYSQNHVVVEDSVYEKYFKDFSAEIDFTVLSSSDYSNLMENKSRGPYKSVIAYITEKTFVSIQGTPEKKDMSRAYLLKKRSYVPSLPADFTESTSTDAPKLEISLSDVKNMPEENRALPVNGKYAGEEGYGLEESVYAWVSVLVPSFSESVFGFCDSVFKDKSESEGKTTFIASVGDMMVARGVQEILMDDENGLEKVFGSTLPLLQNSDLTMGNLEGVVTESNWNTVKTYVFKFHKEVLAELKKAGFDYLMQANNHCYDYGENGFKDTLAALEEYQIPTSGAGYNYEEAKQFYHTTINGNRFAIISCGAYPVERSGFNGEKMASAKEDRAGILWQNEELFENIRKEKDEGNFVIVNVHGGEEYVSRPNAKQRALYERFIDSGADLVLGSHPHVLQPNEWYNGKLIVYSQGNFIFNKMGNMASFGALDSEVVRIGIIDGRIVYTEIYPAKINGTSVNLK